MKQSYVTLSVSIVVNNFACIKVTMNLMVTFMLSIIIEMDEDGCWFV